MHPSSWCTRTIPPIYSKWTCIIHSKLYNYVLHKEPFSTITMQPQENPARVFLGLHGSSTEGLFLKNLYCLESIKVVLQSAVRNIYTAIWLSTINIIKGDINDFVWKFIVQKTKNGFRTFFCCRFYSLELITGSHKNINTDHYVQEITKDPFICCRFFTLLLFCCPAPCLMTSHLCSVSFALTKDTS